MKPGRFTDEQIIGSCGSRRRVRRLLMSAARTGSPARRFTNGRPSTVGGGVGRQTAEGAGKRERQIEEVVGRGDARQRHAQGRCIKKMMTPAARREAVAHLRTTFGATERRACEVLGADRTSVRYRGRRADDAVVRAHLREPAAIRRRFGYRRLLEPMRRGLMFRASACRAIADRAHAQSSLCAQQAGVAEYSF
jgi:hypothetical protein